MRIAGGLTVVAFGIAIGYAAASQVPAQSEQPAERVTGIGGVFFKAKDPRALAVWYRDHLGLVPEPVGPEIISDFNGRFAWATDPEGKRIQLWEPKAGY